ncbi:hypothetical protein [Acetobacterium woodii]|uniref:Uncharacterized protein n=1 Tax=Acetobacterium woodii (strain ATCC 29683 / DSM 1030 / JCM 2381 / KCTC 1655 / WB1) TaxID=931626 RepID=H6LGW9_ACEWD|nr:hypothetical protein [Acetobacterium woodii]AFA49633.1 hypothetical protein Awo_c28840 [Acetobacterium woodii DSM 1030]
MSGTEGLGYRLEGIQIKLTGIEEMDKLGLRLVKKETSVFLFTINSFGDIIIKLFSENKKQGNRYVTSDKPDQKEDGIAISESW